MIWLVLGVAIWTLSHSFKRLAPAAAANIPETRRKNMVSLASLVAIVLMVIGYRSWSAGLAFTPPAWGAHANNLLMLIAVYLLAASGMKTRITRVIRHPMATGVILWSVAHLLANGDWASVVLFGGIAGWAVLSIILENAQKTWIKPPVGPAGKEIGAIVGAVVVVAVIGYVHTFFGLMPFGG
jgi:uncharacterized membrane protein